MIVVDNGKGTPRERLGSVRVVVGKIARQEWEEQMELVGCERVGANNR